MTTITEMSRANVKQIHQDADDLMRKFAEERGLTMSPHGASYDPTSGTVKVSFTMKLTVTVDGKAQEQADFERHCGLYDLKATDYKRKFMFRGQQYEIIGFNLNKPKYSVRGKRVHDGKVFGLPQTILSMNDRILKAEMFL